MKWRKRERRSQEKIHIDLLKYKSRSFILFTGYKETGRILLSQSFHFAKENN